MKRFISAVAFAAVIGNALPAFGAGLGSMVDAEADAQGIPRDLAHAVVKIESNYDCALRGRAGERGIMQVKPATAREVGVMGNLFDCSTGLSAGMRYLKIALARGGIGCAGLSLYNRGIAAAPKCTAYGRRVLRVLGKSSRTCDGCSPTAYAASTRALSTDL